MLRYLVVMVALALAVVFYEKSKNQLPETARWQHLTEDGTLHRIVKVDDYWVETLFDKNSGSFFHTYGGVWQKKGDSLVVELHFDSNDSSRVGNEVVYELSKLDNDAVQLSGKVFDRVKGEAEGALAGAWFINGRMRDGKLQERAFGPRRTLKILTESTFQWIAYHVETGAFSGTGGGLYETTETGDYIEKIEFFSRDKSRVGAELSFQYELKEGDWHHKGLSSRGTPIYEIWGRELINYK